jgi:hypothetical protein
MKKEEKNSSSQNGYQEEELSNLEFGFVHEFFISEGKSGTIGKASNNEKPREESKGEFGYNDQSVTFFLPDFFTRED